MFVDSKFGYAEVQKFFDSHIKWFFEDMSVYDTFANNHPMVSRRNWGMARKLADNRQR